MAERDNKHEQSKEMCFMVLHMIIIKEENPHSTDEYLQKKKKIQKTHGTARYN